MDMKKDFIEKFLMHRDPFLFVDEATLIDDYKTIGKYKLKKNNSLLKGHFPIYPLLPGVLLIEMISQTALLHMIGKTVQEETDKEKLKVFSYEAYLVKVNEFSFRNRIEPEAEIEIKVEVKPSLVDNFFEADGKVFEGKKLKGYGTMFLYFRRRDISKEGPWPPIKK